LRLKFWPTTGGNGTTIYVAIGWALCVLSSLVFIKCKLIARQLAKTQTVTAKTEVNVLSNLAVGAITLTENREGKSSQNIETSHFLTLLQITSNTMI
jgi:hypothetical protein